MNAVYPDARRRSIRLEPYDPRWPAFFEVERVLLRDVLASLPPAIEHIGSTAVPGLGAKPIIDLMVGVTDLVDIENSIGRLSQAGYRYFEEYEAVVPERRFFVKATGFGPPVHLHAIEHSSRFWDRRVRFRNYLRVCPTIAGAYFRLKQHLACKYANDRPAYSEGKTGFIQAVMAIEMIHVSRS